MTTFRGVIPPVITPFTPGGEIDFDGLTHVVEHLIEGGVDGLFMLGSTGEVAYLTDSQRVALVEHVVQRVGGRVPVLAGAIETTARRVIEQARRLEDLGIDALVATPPFYAINDMVEIADHFRAIAAAVQLPLFAYDVPVRLNGVKLAHELLVQLGREGVIVGVKDSSGNDVEFRRLVLANEDAGRPLVLLTGHEVVVDGMLMMGGDGVVPGYANVDPHRYARLWRAAEAGDWPEAKRVQDELVRGFEIVFQATGRSGDAAGVGAFKTAMQALGLIGSNAMAAPVHALDGQVADHIRQIVDSAGVRP